MFALLVRVIAGGRTVRHMGSGRRGFISRQKTNCDEKRNRGARGRSRRKRALYSGEAAAYTGIPYYTHVESAGEAGETSRGPWRRAKAAGSQAPFKRFGG